MLKYHIYAQFEGQACIRGLVFFTNADSKVLNNVLLKVTGNVEEKF